jgi:hypothetical protein
LPSWIRIRIQNTDPDPLGRFNPDPIRIRSGSATLKYTVPKMIRIRQTLSGTNPGKDGHSGQQQQPSPGTGLLSYRLASLNFGRESGGGSSSGSGHKRAFSLPLRGGDKRDAAALAAAASSARGAKEGANNSAVDTSGMYCVSPKKIACQDIPFGLKLTVGRKWIT